MDWKREAVNDLKRFQPQKDSLENIKARIQALKAQYGAIKCSMGDSTPVKGGASRIEDRLLDNIVERQRLTYTYRATERLVELVERGLSGLDERELRILELFYIRGAKGNVERLMEELDLEKTRLYELKDDALYKFTVREYGLPDY
ncbi:hypothetical protein [Acetanaerobacterium elongatum]|uniref:Phage transcriptional regulator, RinA family n=1 Tax=Acetanaerobacterium elongatum TaxID=258515 RepID=A0A1G9Z177_9FIRM|nr:hypothetical protein [Acetanaerobacterium elongatum]SDN14735.1 hypothetical protein SAMN05192585_11245 [Acetanaerobacterium elongatum]